MKDMMAKYMNIKKRILKCLLFGVVLLSGVTALEAQTTWAVKNTGNWSESRNWTTDKSGQSYINPGSKIPDAGDNIIIPAGKTITYNAKEALVLNKLTVEGKLVVTEANELLVSAYDGLGTISVTDMGSIDPLKVASFDGTWELNGDNSIPGGVYNSVVVAKGTQRISGDVTVKRDLTIKDSAVVVFEPGAHKATVHNIVIEAGASLTSEGIEGEGQESELHVTGDFINRGTVEFCTGGRTDYNNQKSKRVVLYFEGNEDGEFSAEGTTTLYRLVCRKNVGVTQSVIAPGGINMLGRTIDMGSYKNLPWVPESGVLKLCEGVNIEHWGEAYNINQQKINITKAGQFYIPEIATLWIAGANVKLGKEQVENVGTLVGNALVAGTLRITAGRLNLEDYSWGIIFVSSQEGEPIVNTCSSLIVDGGVIRAPRIVCWDWNISNTISRPVIYKQTGGEVLFDVEQGQEDTYIDKPFCGQTLFMGDGSEFVMTGGLMRFSCQPANTNWVMKGILMCDTNGGAIENNVEGGTIEFVGDKIDEFFVYIPFALNNVVVKDNAVIKTKIYGSNYSTLYLNGDLRVENGGQFATEFDVELGGSLYVDENSVFTAKSDASGLSTLRLFGGKNSTYTDKTGQLKWSNISVAKQSGEMVVSEGSKISITGSLDVLSGYLSGEIEFLGSKDQVLLSESGELDGIDLVLVKEGGMFSLGSDVYLNSVSIERGINVNLGKYNLKLNEYPTSKIDWGTSVMFHTDNSYNAGGLTLPVPTTNNDSNIFPIGCNGKYVPVKPLFTNSGDEKFITVVPVNGIHPNVESGVYDIFWRVTTDAVVEEGVDTYQFTLSGDITQSPASLFVKGDELYEVASNIVVENSTIIGDTYTTGDFVIGQPDVFSGAKTYVSAKSGNWNDAIWYEKDGTDDTLFVGTSIRKIDNVIIKPGHVVSFDNGYSSVGDVCIEREGESAGVLRISNSGLNVTSVSGNGQLCYIGEVKVNSDLSVFNTDAKSEVVFEVTAGTVYIWDNLGSLEFPNLYIKGGTANALSLGATNGHMVVRGDLVLEANLFWGFNSRSSLEVLGDMIVSEDCKFEFTDGYSSSLVLYGDLHNNGDFVKLNSNSNNPHEFKIGGSIENNGKIFIPQTHVVLFGETGAGSNVCKVYGTSTNFGDTYFEYLTLSKSDVLCRVQLNIPVGSADGSCNVELLKGKLHLNYDSEYITIYKAYKAKYTWNGAIEGYSLLDDFHIPETCEIIVDNGCKLRLWCPTTQSPDCHRVELSGGLKLLGGSEVSVNSATSGEDVEGQYSGFAYTSSKNSKLYMGAGTKLTAAFLTSFTSDASIDVEMVSNATIDIVPSSAVYGSYGAFDIRGGKVAMSDKSIININNASSVFSTDASLYYNPVTSNVGKAQFNIKSDTEPFFITAYMPLGTLNVEPQAKVKLLHNKLSLGGDLLVNGSFDSMGEDVEVNGNMTVAGTYVPSGNVTRFINQTQSQTLTATDSLTLYGLESSSMKLSIAKAVTVEDDFTVTGGEVVLRGDMTLKGDALIEYKSAVSGNALLMKGERAQVFDCEGTVNSLTIDNANGVMSSRQQANPIVIGKKLTLTNGVFSIGGNLLELKDGAMIVGEEYSSDCMVATYNSPTDRGIRICMTQDKPYTMLLPFGESSKYTPIQLNGLVSSTTGKLTFVPNNDTEPSVASNPDGDYLKFYWTVKASNVNVTDGDFVCYGLKSDAKGYSEESYKAAFLNLATGKWTQIPDAVTSNGDYIEINFKPRGDQSDVAGRYTAGKDLPNALQTYIAVENGEWGSSIWKVYNTDTKKAEGDNIIPTSFSGCAVIIDAHVTMSENNEGIKLSSLVINEGKKLDVGTTQNNQVGYISGTGTLKVQSGDAVPSGVYDDFLEVGGGTIEYGGSGDYNVFISSVYANNVVFSGTGKRYLRSDRIIQVNGDMTIEGAEVVFGGKDVTLLGDLTILGGHTSGSGSLVFAGDLRQEVISTKNIVLSGIELNNLNGVSANCGLEVMILQLTKGVLDLGNNAICVKGTIVGGSSSCYVNGELKRKLSSGTEYKFPVGDASRYGEASVLPSSSGEWSVRYYNVTPPNVESKDTKVTDLGAEYWAVKGDAGKMARVRVRWDMRSGTFTNTSKMATYDGSKWVLIECNSPVGQTMLAVSAETNMSGEPRLYTLATAAVRTDYIWTGAESEDWSSPSNWEGGELPSLASNVVIPAVSENYPVISGQAYCKDMTVEAGASLILDINGYLNVEGIITNNGNITMLCAYDANPSFVYKNDMVGNKITVRRMLIPGKVTYTGSATKEKTVSGLTQENDKIRRMASGEICTYTDGNKGSFDAIGIGNDVLASNIDGTAREISQTGTLVKADEIISVSLGKGWNFVSNPYPFNVNVDKLIVANEDIEPSVWVRTFDFGSRKYCWITRNTKLQTETGVESVRVVAPFQGIHVYAQAPTTLTFDPTALSTSVGTSLKSLGTDELTTDELRLAIKGDEINSYVDEAVIVFREGGSMEVIRGDSKKQQQAIDYSSIAIAKEGQSMTIAYLPETTEMEEVELPLVVTKSSKSSSLTIYANSISSFDPRYDVILVDKQNGEMTNLREEDYEVIDTDDLTDRFVVVLRQRGTCQEPSTSIEQEKESQLSVYATGHTIYIKSSEQAENAVVTLYDIAGSVIKRVALVSPITCIDVETRGVYIVNVCGTSSKVVIE